MSGARETALQLVPRLDVGGVETGVRILQQESHTHHIAIATAHASNLDDAALALTSASLARRDPLSVLVVNPLLLLRYLRANHVRVVHARSRLLALSAAIALLAAPRGTRLVATCHGSYSTSWWLKRILLLPMLRADATIFPSHATARRMPALARKPFVIYRGVRATGEHAPHTPVAPPPGCPVVLLPGRFSRTKGADVLLRALRRRKSGTPLRVDLVGARPEQLATGSEWRGGRDRLVRQLDALADDVAHLGIAVSMHAFAHDMSGWYATSTVVVVPSRRPEAFGRVVVEAILAGRLVVTFAHGAAPEIAAALWDAEAAPLELLGRGVCLAGSIYLVAPLDEQGLEMAINAAIRMPPTESKWRVHSARARARRCFSIEEFVKRTESVYDEVRE